MDKFGDRLRRLRSDRGLSLDELAAKAGVTKAYLWRLETSPSVNPSLDIVGKVAVGLGVSTASLIPEPARPNEEALELPPALLEAQRQIGIAPDDVADLARIRFRGGQPMTSEDWIGLYLQLKRSSKKEG